MSTDIMPDMHWRLGWSTVKENVETPTGYTWEGYGIRDIDGDVIHDAQRYPYGEGFGVCYLDFVD